MKKGLRRAFAGVALATTLMGLGAGCSKPSDRVSENISNAADHYEINRRIVFYNGITGEYMATIQGLCSLGNDDPAGQLTVTCKVGEDQYIKNFLGLSDNVTYMVQQLDPAEVSSAHYDVTFNPSALVPNVNLSGDTGTPPAPTSEHPTSADAAAATSGDPTVDTTAPDGAPNRVPAATPRMG